MTPALEVFLDHRFHKEGKSTIKRIISDALSHLGYNGTWEVKFVSQQPDKGKVTLRVKQQVTNSSLPLMVIVKDPDWTYSITVKIVQPKSVDLVTIKNQFLEIEDSYREKLRHRLIASAADSVPMLNNELAENVIDSAINTANIATKESPKATQTTYNWSTEDLKEFLFSIFTKHGKLKFTPTELTSAVCEINPKYNKYVAGSVVRHLMKNGYVSAEGAQATRIYTFELAGLGLISDVSPKADELYRAAISTAATIIVKPQEATPVAEEKQVAVRDSFVQGLPEKLAKVQEMKAERVRLMAQIADFELQVAGIDTFLAANEMYSDKDSIKKYLQDIINSI